MNPTPRTIYATKPQLGYSQYLAACYHMGITQKLGLAGDHPDYGRIMMAAYRLGYGRLAIELLGGLPNNFRVFTAESPRQLLTYRTCDDPDEKIVLVRLEDKPVLKVVGWTRGRTAMASGTPSITRGLEADIPSFTLPDHLLNPILDVQDLRTK